MAARDLESKSNTISRSSSKSGILVSCFKLMDLNAWIRRHLGSPFFPQRHSAGALYCTVRSTKYGTSMYQHARLSCEQRLYSYVGHRAQQFHTYAPVLYSYCTSYSYYLVEHLFAEWSGGTNVRVFSSRRDREEKIDLQCCTFVEGLSA